MRFLSVNNQAKFRGTNLFRKGKEFLKILFFISLSLSITFSNFAQEDDSDFLEKVLEDKPKKQEPKKTTPATVANANTKDKKKKLSKNTKKTVAKPVTKVDPNKKNKPLPVDTTKQNPSQNLSNNKLNLEYWIHEELTMNSKNIPGFEEPKVANNGNLPNNTNVLNVVDKPIEKKPNEKVIEKDVKPNALITFLNEYKKTIFIFAAIIIFAIYRLRYAGARNYNNSGRIFSKFRNK